VGAPQDGAEARPDAGAGSDAKDPYLEFKMRVHQELLDTLNLSAIEKREKDDLGREIGEIVQQLLEREKAALNQQERARLVSDVLDELLGLGPLEPLLKDPTISDILVNTHDTVWVERRGKLELSGVRFQDERHLLRIINKIVSAVGRRVDESVPLCDARLPDGSRVNAVVPPIAVDGSMLSIRKFSKMPYSMDRLVGVAGDRARARVHCSRPAERDHLGRHGLRQDDHAERDVELHRATRVDRYH
jgi:pilus assembly protein CpaF